MIRFTCLILLTLLSAAPATRPAPATAPAAKFKLGTIRAEVVRESSGIVASRRHEGVFWVINDSGNAPALYAITRDGELLREYPVDATNTDWEDLAIDDDGHLFIADVGNNQRRRKEVAVYRIDEPDPRAVLRGRAGSLRVSASWRVKFAGEPFDCESMFVLDRKGYVIPKRLLGTAEVFRFDMPVGADADKKPVTLERVTALPGVPGAVTAADVSNDGKRLAVLTIVGPYVFDGINGDVARAGKITPRHSRYIHPNMEAACFTPEGLLVTTESRDLLLFRDETFK